MLRPSFLRHRAKVPPVNPSELSPHPFHRHSIRLKGFDYSQRGLYFVTICAYRKRCLFGKVVNKAVHLTALGRIVDQTWLEIPLHFPHVELQPFVVMPNHIHGVLAIVRSQVKRPHLVGAQHAAPLQDPDPSLPNPTPRVLPGSLSALVRSFKAAVTKRAKILRPCPTDPIWQRNYYERVLRSGKEFGDASRYIWENPLKWDADLENPARKPDS